VEYALSHGTNRVNCEMLIMPYYSMCYDVIRGATCGFRGLVVRTSIDRPKATVSELEKQRWRMSALQFDERVMAMLKKQPSFVRPMPEQRGF
jgi:hypothetical protein